MTVILAGRPPFRKRTNTKKIFSNSQCEFGYRESFFKTTEGKNYFITKVFLKLKKEISPKISYADLKNYFNEFEQIEYVFHNDDIQIVNFKGIKKNIG